MSLGGMIATYMFADGGPPKGLLFAFGLIMFIFVMVLNAIAMYATKKRKKSR
jgi:ABC-type phosphate transport system permease subunit